MTTVPADIDVSISRGQTVGGHAIGVLVIDDTFYPMMPGNVANATTFNFPVLYERLDISVAQILAAGPELVQTVIAGARELQRRGVRAVVGACGTFANYQSAVAAAVDVPVFMSILTQVPFLLQALSPNKKLLIVAATDSLFTPNIKTECGITDDSRLVVSGCQTLPEFRNILESRGHLNSATLQRELLAHVGTTIEQHPDIGAILIQCSDLPPYAMALQDATGLPVFDMTNLISWLHSCVVRQPVRGYI